MAHQPSHRRILATPMDPTLKKLTSSSSTTATTTSAAKYHPHPLPDPTIIPPSSIQHISHRFSKLYANHKKIVSTKPPNFGGDLKPSLHPEPETDFQPKTHSVSPVSHTSCTTLTKSKSQHISSRNNNNDLGVEKEQYLSSKTKKLPSSKKLMKDPKLQSFQESDVKKASQLMSKSHDFDKVKKLEKVGPFEMRRPSLSSSIPPMVNGGRRKSFCSSQVELADFFSCSGVKIVAVDMPPFMQIHAVDCARKVHDSLEKFTSKTLALTLKKEFDGVYGPAWHCIVGTSFGSFVTHSVGGFMYFSMDHKLYILLFKTTVQRAE
ncbi:hypothetical protein ACJIZ3_005244 [Penstemon smallii]|uniref:Dynein light chain n=1 Tax=Penstemon smallii TaxID=265156 RepID=A0ABD3S4C0_9LAMI